MPICRNRRTVSRSPDGQADVLRLEAAMGLADAGAVVRVALEVAAVRLAEALPRGAVDVVDRPARDRRQPAGDERLPQALRGDREVRERGEPAEALAEQAPALHAQLARGSTPRRGRSSPPGSGRGRRPAPRRVSPGICGPTGRGPAGAALVEEQDAVLGRAPGASIPTAGWWGGSASNPGPPWRNTRYGRSGRPGAATSRVKTVIDGPSGSGVVQRDAVLALGQDGAGYAVDGGHHGALPTSAGGRAA